MADESIGTATIELAGAQLRCPVDGVVELWPAQDSDQGPATLISAAIHGNETAPIELLLALVAALDAGRLRVGAPTLLVLGHPASIVAGKRYLETNLNRLFRRDEGAAAPALPDSLEHRRARLLMQAVDNFWLRAGTKHTHGTPLHLDLHTAIRASRYPRFVVEPFSVTATPRQTWDALAGAGLQAGLLQHRHSWTFSHYSRHYHGVVAFTLELGKVAPFGANDLAALAPMQALLAARIEGRLAGAGSITGPVGRSAADMAFFRVVSELLRESDDFELCFGADIANFTAFETGQTIARDGATTIRVTGEPLYVVFPNAQVERGARAALLARPVAAPT